MRYFISKTGGGQQEARKLASWIEGRSLRRKAIFFCIFFGFSYIFIKYELKNELIIYWNHGIEKISVINFFLIFSILVFLIQIILLTIVTPKSQEIAKSLIRTSEVDYFEGLIKPKKFNDNIKGLTIFAEDNPY